MKGRHQIVLLDQRPPTRIDQNGRVFHAGKGLCVEEMPVGGKQRGVQADIV